MAASIDPPASSVSIPAHHLVFIAGGFSACLGLLVLIGWHSHNIVLIQVSSAFVPMQYNTALGFFLCGTGLFAIQTRWAVGGVVCGALALLISGLTLFEYAVGLDIGIDQAFMEHYIQTKTSHPGRMAPNTAICFSLSGLGLVLLGAPANFPRFLVLTGILGAFVMGLAVVAFSGYFTQLETAYGWGKLTRMAIHTAAGFMVLGSGMMAQAWDREPRKTGPLPYWFHWPIGIGIFTVAVALWQAMAFGYPDRSSGAGPSVGQQIA